MQLRYAFRLYPEPGQRAALARAFGCARVVFNDAVRAREERRAAVPAEDRRREGEVVAGIARRAVQCHGDP
ncbi:helix-turn-helix domain-containing protein [Streptomyces bobili]